MRRLSMVVLLVLTSHDNIDVDYNDLPMEDVNERHNDHAGKVHSSTS